MHVISRKALLEFAEKYPDSRTPLDVWFRIMEKNQFGSFDSLRKVFPGADKVSELYVFNIGGNKYRIITAIHFNRHNVYVRHVLTHSEYDKGKWKL